MNAPSAQSKKISDTSPHRRRQSNRRMLVAGVLVFVAFAMVMVMWNLSGNSHGESDDDVKRSVSSEKVRPNRATMGTDASVEEPFTLIDDDLQTLWVSPTRGEPLSLAYLPPGVQIIMALRPNAFEDHRESRKVFDALGPIARHRGELLEERLLNPPRGVTQLIVGLSATGDGAWQTTMVARLGEGLTAAQHLATRLSRGIEETRNGITYLVANNLAYYAPGDDQQLMVVAPAAAITEIIDMRGDPPPLRRDVERLLKYTDADRHFTVIVPPNFLFGKGRNIFGSQFADLHEPLYWFLGDELSAAALSVHWDDSFFIELLAAPTLDTSPERTARMLAERVAQIPDALEEYVVGLDPSPYGRRVVARFPAMVRKLAGYTRSGFDVDHAVLRCYLPAIAGHNLLMGAELTLAESFEANGSERDAQTPSRTISESDALDLQSRLQRRTSLSFPSDTLEAALDQLSRDLGVGIVIASPDLQAEGITKNQSFRIDMTDRPAEEILVEILRLANPDKSAAGPGDPRQKLVYVLSAAEPGTPERIVITTRSAAAARGQELPPIFRAK